MRQVPVRRITLAVWILASGFLLAGGSGCSGESAPPQGVVKRQAPKPEAKAPVAPVVETKEQSQAKKAEQVALYDPRGKRDPFVSFVMVEQRGKAGVRDALLPPLQRYDLGELKFVGVLWTKKGVMGLVEDGEGKGYSVTVGTRIGRSGGVVRRITGKEIIVKEEFVGDRGKKVVKESGIQLTTAGGK